MTEKIDIKVNVEYCGSCGYRKQFLLLAEEIKKNASNATVTGAVGRQRSFEVQVNDELVYSMLDMRVFPNFAAIADMIKDVSAGEPVRQICPEQLNCVLS